MYTKKKMERISLRGIMMGIRKSKSYPEKENKFQIILW